MKTSKILLKIASGIMLFHGLVLLVGTFATTPNPAPPTELLDFFMGATFCGILLVLLLGVLLWVLSCLKDNSEIKLLWIVTIATVMLGIIEIIYFFPYIVCILPGILALIALLMLNKRKYRC